MPAARAPPVTAATLMKVRRSIPLAIDLFILISPWVILLEEVTGDASVQCGAPHGGLCHLTLGHCLRAARMESATRRYVGRVRHGSLEANAVTDTAPHHGSSRDESTGIGMLRIGKQSGREPRVGKEWVSTCRSRWW